MSIRVTVFGGSQPKPGDPIYQDAVDLGVKLAERGYILLNGGYIGTMEGLSRGAAEAGGHVIGVTSEQIEAWRPVKANPWVKEEWHYNTLQERIFSLIENSDAYIALPGGVGTLAEIMLTWNLLLTHIIPSRPLILIGPGWQAMIESFISKLGEFIPDNQRGWISFAPNVNLAIQQLQELLPDVKL
jgi:uncharacterized protein (TIGR00730 family)